MVRNIKPDKVKTSVVTKNGECKIELTLNININSEGVTVNANATAAEEKKKKYIDKEEDNVAWAIPEFDSEKIDFGKQKIGD